MPFSPLSISGCIYWYVADDLASGGTWINRGSVASGLSTLSVLGSNSPVLRTNYLNGHKVVEFTVGSGLYQSPLASSANYPAVTQLSVLKHLSAPSGAVWAGLVNRTGRNRNVNFSMSFLSPSGWNFFATNIASTITANTRRSIQGIGLATNRMMPLANGSISATGIDGSDFRHIAGQYRIPEGVTTSVSNFAVTPTLYLNDWMLRVDAASSAYSSIKRNGTLVGQTGVLPPLPTSSSGFLPSVGKSRVISTYKPLK
jgi:hypothetical protein